MARADRLGSADPAEIEKFSALAEQWWDASGSHRPLHRLNPARLVFVRDEACRWFRRDARLERPLAGLAALDVGCGGGLLAEPLTRLGATVTGIDASAETVRVAGLHASRMGLEIDYRALEAEDLAEAGESYDLVLAMEIVEHVASLEVFLSACCKLLRPGGAFVMSTLNRTPKAFVNAILGAEYLLRWLPRGTHDWRRFRRPSEISAILRRHGLQVAALSGLVYNPLTDSWRLSPHDLDVNYLMLAGKEERKSGPTSARRS